MNSIRCCISCILPCGALDVVRIVHSNGHVEEISGSIMAADIMKAHPKHVLKLPSSPSPDGMVPNIVVVPPDAMLQRGKIYFLLPLPPTPRKPSSTTINKRGQTTTYNSNSHRGRQHRQNRSMSNADNNPVSVSNLSTTDRRRGRVGVWRPHLKSISETPNDDG
ncbi:hypothetical protein GQ457_07G029630 [Hibiscus cannabinus]